MASKKGARKARAGETSKRPATRPQHYAAPSGNVDLTEKQALGLWELILASDGKTAGKRAVALLPADVEHLTKSLWR